MLIIWVGGLLLASYLNGGPGRLERPASLLVAGTALASVTVTFSLLLTSSRFRALVLERAADISGYRQPVRLIVLVSGVLAVACVGIGVGRLVSAGA
jgi:hypothetical protein